MPKKQALTVAELKSLILMRFNMEQRKHVEFHARLQRALGREVQEEQPGTAAIQNKFADWISDVLARRLKQNRRTTPLLSSRDFDKFVSSMINEIAKAEGHELEAEEKKILGKCMESIFENICEMVRATVPPRKNPYEESWRWVTTVLDLAAERGISPTEFLTLENATDEITRRMFTKKQFVALSKRAMNKFMDADALKKIIVQTSLDMLGAEADEEDRRELEQELETELMPQLRETLEKSRMIISPWLGEEVERIYTRS